jgi:hypothetical protein
MATTGSVAAALGAHDTQLNPRKPPERALESTPRSSCRSPPFTVSVAWGCHGWRTPLVARAKGARPRWDQIPPLPRAVRSRQSIASSRAVSAVLMSKSSCPRLSGTDQRSSFPGPRRTS